MTVQRVEEVLENLLTLVGPGGLVRLMLLVLGLALLESAPSRADFSGNSGPAEARRVVIRHAPAAHGAWMGVNPVRPPGARR